MPSHADFFEVVCENLSAGGLAFYLDEEPEFEDLIVALGRPPLLAYFTARVVRVADKTLDGRRVCLVGCHLTGRVPPERIRPDNRLFDRRQL